MSKMSNKAVEEQTKQDFQPIGQWVIVKCHVKESSIIIPNENKKSIMIEKCEVYGVGEEVKYVKKGDIVHVTDAALTLPQFRMSIPGYEELFLKIKEEEVVGIIIK